MTLVIAAAMSALHAGPGPERVAVFSLLALGVAGGGLAYISIPRFLVAETKADLRSLLLRYRSGVVLSTGVFVICEAALLLDFLGYFVGITSIHDIRVWAPVGLMLALGVIGGALSLSATTHSLRVARDSTRPI